MSNFNPTHTTIQPPQPPGQLAGAVINALGRPIIKSRPWGPLKSLLLGGISFGILPLLVWPKRLSDYAVAEQEQFWHLAEWLWIRTGDRDAAALRKSINRTGPRISIWLVPMVLLIAICGTFFPLVAAHPFHPHELISVTYGYPRRWADFSAWNPAALPPSYFFKTWTLCLSVAYAFHWLQIRQHALDVDRMVRGINQVLTKENLEPVMMAPVGYGPGRLIWLMVGIIGVLCGAWWAVPAVLAGRLQARYIHGAGPWIRGQLSQRVRLLLLSDRPSMDLAGPVRFGRVCPNPACRAPLPEMAAFCSRCGRRVAGSVDRLA